MVGELRYVRVKPGETLLDIAVRERLGFVELRAANPGVDAWVPEPGTSLLLPTAHLLPPTSRSGLVINLSEQRLYYFAAPDRPPETYPIGIGRQAWKTPLGETRVVRKRTNPYWTVPQSIRAEQPDLPMVVPPGPDNPLGEHTLDLGWPAYLLHGTNMPDGIGRRVSHGCIRLYPDHIARLQRRVPIGTTVTVIDQPVKFGWVDGDLYLEVHPSQSQADEIELDGGFTPEPVPGLESWMRQVAGDQVERLDLALVEKVARERRGVPVRITGEGPGT